MIYHIAIQGEWDAQADLPTYVPYCRETYNHLASICYLNRQFETV